MISCFSGGMPMPVSFTEKAMTDLARFESIWFSVIPAAGDGAHIQRNRASVGELERVGEQVLENLLQALGVGVHVAGQVGGHIHDEIELLASATWRKVRST